MSVTPHQWLIAFIIACVIHVAAGAAILLAQHEAAQAPQEAPRGVMVSLDDLQAGNHADATELPEPVAPVEATPSQPTPTPPATTEDIENTPSEPSVPSEPDTETPAPNEPAPVAPAGITPVMGDVIVPTTQAVTIKAADTLQALDQPEVVHARSPSASGSSENDNGANGTSQNPTTTYIARIRGWLGTHKYYPEAARNSGAEGTVRLHLVVGRDGHVISAAIAKSSGNNALDQAAMDMVKRSEPLPPMSDNMLRTRLEIILPVQFTLGETPAG